MLIVDERHRATNDRLAAELAEVEARFAAELVSDLTCVNDLVRHIERYRGKMLRPCLLLLSGLAIDPNLDASEAHRTLATVVETVHMATLVHDDVLDESEVRRRGETVNALRGNEAAVMLGDYLISHAYHLCSDLQSQTAARLIAQTTNTVCEGELLQLANRDNWSLDEQTYFEIIRRKTGSLCGVACRLGALFAGADSETSRMMHNFGEQLGAAFQIIDDVLDLTGTPNVVGKSLGKDLEKGKLTLPLIHRLETAGPAERQHLLELLRSEREQRANEIGRLLAESDSVDYARRRAEQRVKEASTAIARLPATSARDMFLAVADAVVTRQA
jgi:octaprenyl-diphosphate synthase